MLRLLCSVHCIDGPRSCSSAYLRHRCRGWWLSSQSPTPREYHSLCSRCRLHMQTTVVIAEPAAAARARAVEAPRSTGQYRVARRAEAAAAAVVAIPEAGGVVTSAEEGTGMFRTGRTRRNGSPAGRQRRSRRASPLWCNEHRRRTALAGLRTCSEEEARGCSWPARGH